DAFEDWMEVSVLKPGNPVAEEMLSWLPDELVEDKNNKRAEMLVFVKTVATDLLKELTKIGNEIETGEEEEEEPEEPVTLLDLLFDKGLLPSYAFPTDLCSFVIQEYGDHGRVVEKERPQLAKVQGLSEYAPGRLLVVNKQTYRVGGIFLDAPPTASPAIGVFS